MSKPTSTIRYSLPKTASQTETNQGLVAASTKPRMRSGWSSTYQRSGPRGSAPPGTDMASSNNAMMSSYNALPHSAPNAPFKAMMPSPYNPPMIAATSYVSLVL